MQSLLIYIDPGSGSYLIQAIIAGILGIAFFFKNIVLFVKDFFYRIFKNNSKSS